MKKLILLSASTFVLFTFFYFFYLNKETPILFLTWDNEDTSHTMTINYLSSEPSQKAIVYYDIAPQGGQPEKYRYKMQGEIRTYPGINFSVHSVHLENLDPEEDYYFIAGDKTTGFSNERKFRTVPENGRIHFISGGDASVSENFKALCKIAAQDNPHFAIIGGDIAYANGDVNSQSIWLAFLKIWQDTMITAEGYTIPLIAGIGNHEINDTPYLPTKTVWDKAPFYYMLFHPADDKTFFERQLGKNAVLFILDTDHIYSSAGEQLAWLNTSFAKHSNANFRFASYHVPLYPSYRDPEAEAHVTLRKNWLKTFDNYNLDIGFENHEHTLKKTKLLKNNKVVDTRGTYYLGDGSWGTASFTPVERWYLQQSKAISHVWSVTMDTNKTSFKVLTIDGVDEKYSFDIMTANHEAKTDSINNGKIMN